MARLDALIYAVGDTPAWSGAPTPQDATVTPAAIAAVAGVGSPSIISVTPAPAKDAAGLSMRADSVVDTGTYANNAPLDHIFLKVPWSAIAPLNNGVYDWHLIDDALTALPNCKFTLRIQAGDTAPGWVKTGSGGAIDVYNTSRKITANCARWWTTFARTAWQNMINACGARYDTNQRIVIVSADLVMAVYSEPFILGNDPASGVRLWNAGLQGSAQQAQAIKDNVADTIAAFPNTLVEMCGHDQFQYTTSTGVASSYSIGRQLAYDVCLAYGPHLILSDYGLGATESPAAKPGNGGGPLTESDWYRWMMGRALGTGAYASIGGPTFFQYTLGSGPTQQTYVDAGNNAIGWKAQMVETSGYGSMTSQQRIDLQAGLEANAW